MTTKTDPEFDVAVVGGGIGGAALAAVLARHGVRVVIIEAGGHPRFAIGESTVPETIMGLRNLARRYDVPELENLSSHGLLRRYVSAASGVKRNFSFAYHREGEPFRPAECTQYPTWGPPIGPDSHFFRQDVDAYVYQVALRYGATGMTYRPVTGVDFDDAGATVSTADGAEIRVRYVVDAGGMRSVLGEALDLRTEPPYRTRSRTIFTHFTGVEPFDRIAGPRRRHGMPSPFSQGTLHHLFEGGWMWVIPFDNHLDTTSRLCSVGINLDIDRYPRPADESAEDEFWAHVRRFPDLHRQLRDARPVRPYTASNRNQFASRQLVGDRWCLLPHASDFIDPLFSSGLAVTVMALNALGHRLIDAVRDDDFSPERFEYVETWVKRSFAYYDDLVAYSYVAFDDFELWNAWFRVWTIGTLYGVNGQMQAGFDFDRTRNRLAFDRLEQAPYRGVQAVDNPECAVLFERACAAMRAYRDKEIGVGETCGRIYSALADSGLSPDFWRTQDPSQRCPSGPFTLASMTRILLWGKRRSPDHVRGRYFTGGFDVVARDALAFYGAELGSGAGVAYRGMRDMVSAGNRDWRRTP
ncbi:FADH2 O2-dependent halogenase [Nocardia transvalensis]|uniref:FADH2 O2-dependent halogenase n=1 Tax=Nocardia transvalensis TaxID=37333 RepID=A0A7W9P9W6_9NOCA|nr:tryptophan 7-halogenase [Nocardia transvalensis]MBB5912204.1 FADH2 O2-dependent halogenase [Nocardia transvalensis]